MVYSEIIFFSSFILFVLVILFIDLGLFSKKRHTITFRQSVVWTMIWVSLAISFYFFIRFNGNWIHGVNTIENIQTQIEIYQHPIEIIGLDFNDALRIYNNNLALEYLTGYIIEYSLSVDNVFVMILIFLSFGVDQRYYKKVLLWGILGAIVMRFIFIFLSAVLIQKFSWILYIFGGFLIYTAFIMFMKFIKGKKKKIDPKHHPVVKFTSRFFQVYPSYVRQKFFIRKDGIIFLTPLFIVLLVIEFSDVIFAVDSVPAIFSVTKDPYIVFFSNIFAIIGLRSLFFLLSNIINHFFYLKLGLAFLLGFVGVKMLLPFIHIEISTIKSLIIICIILGLSVMASLLFPKREKKTDKNIE